MYFIKLNDICVCLLSVTYNTVPFATLRGAPCTGAVAEYSYWTMSAISASSVFSASSPTNSRLHFGVSAALASLYRPYSVLCERSNNEENGRFTVLGVLSSLGCCAITS